VQSHPDPFLSSAHSQLKQSRLLQHWTSHTRVLFLSLFTTALSCYLTPQFLKQLPHSKVQRWALQSTWKANHWLLYSSVHRPTTAPNLPTLSVTYMTDPHQITL
jgi:hypothetical protein